MKRSHSGGFSLIELLIVLGLILLMYVMAYGPAQKPYQEARLVSCKKHLQLIYMAMNIYAADCHGVFPSLAAAATAEQPLSLLVPRATTDTSMFLCPGSRDRPLPTAQAFTGRKISFAYYMGRTRRDGAAAMLLSDEQINTQQRHAGEQMFSADGKRPGNNHRQYGGNILFGDGHVEAVPSVAPRDFIFPNTVTLLNPKL